MNPCPEQPDLLAESSCARESQGSVTMTPAITGLQQGLTVDGTDWDREQEQYAVDGPGPQTRKSLSLVGSLGEFDQTRAARRLARLEADAALMRRLQTEGFEGEAWNEVAEALVEYGFQVMRAWVVTGQVFARLAEKRRSVPAPPQGGIPRSDALMLAEDSVADAIVDFRDRVLKNGHWDPSRGASLATFFIGNCLLFQFPNLYRRWRHDHLRSSRQEGPIPGNSECDYRALEHRSPDDPALEVTAADHSRRVIAAALAPIADQTNRAILILRAEGFGIDEIAETLGLDYPAVESRIYRARKKLREGSAA